MKTSIIVFASVLSLIGCRTPNEVKVSGGTLPDPSPISHPLVKRGPTVMISFVFRFKDESTGKESEKRIVVTGVALTAHHVLTGVAPLLQGAKPERILVAVPDYAARRNRLVTEAEIAGKSNSGLLLLKTAGKLSERVTVSSADGPAPAEAIRTVDVLNGSIPGVLHAGTVSYVVEDANTFRLLLVDVPTSASSIGCGIYDADGNLAGLVIGPSSNGNVVNFGTVMAVSAKDIRAFLDAQGVPYLTPRKATAPETKR